MAQIMNLGMSDLPTIYNISYPVGPNMPNVRDDVLLIQTLMKLANFIRYVPGMGPVEATKKALSRARLSVSDIDLFELNEAFASQSLAVARELGLELAKVNVRGGAIALGHPIGASGARILTTLIYALRARGGGRGVAALCVGGGMGTAMVIEV